MSSFSWSWEFLPADAEILFDSDPVKYAALEGVSGIVNVRMNESILGSIGMFLQPLFTPLGFGSQLSSYGWVFIVAVVTGLIAKENVVTTFGVLFGLGGEVDETTKGLLVEVSKHYTELSAYSFMLFNLLCAPCFAAMGAIKREMNNAKWTWAAIGYMCVFAYAISLMVYQLGSRFTAGGGNVIGTIVAAIILAFMLYMIFRPYKEAETLDAREYSAVR